MVEKDKPLAVDATHSILGIKVAVTSLPAAVDRVIQLSGESHGGYVCAANVHMSMEAYDDEDFRATVNNAALVVPDGRPLMWWLKTFCCKEAQQVRGPDLFISVAKAASEAGIPVALYGGAAQALEKLKKYLVERFPGLLIACAISPPYRPLSVDEDRTYTEVLNASGARILFVGLGCPKQEKWMESHKSNLDMAMLGVGAAFDFYSGEKSLAPSWMSKAGLEWFHRLLSDPRRLWRRYLKTNPRFAYLYLKELVQEHVATRSH